MPALWRAVRLRSLAAAAALSPAAAALAPLLLLVLAVVFALWQGRHLTGFTYAPWHGEGLWSDYDEGVYVSSAWQMNHGQAMFSQVFSSQPLLFLNGLALTLRLGGVDNGHLYPLICGLLAATGVAWLAWETSGRWSAVLATAALLVSPGFVIASYAIEAEAPMLAFGSLAVAAAGRYARLGRRRWLAVAALLVAAATLSKLLAVALVLPLLTAMILKWWDIDRRSARDHQGSLAVVVDLLTAAVCGLVPVVAAFVLIAPRAQWDQVVAFHLKASSVAQSKDNLAIFRQFLRWDPGLVAMAIAGLVVAMLLRRRLAFIAAAWVVANVLTLACYQPLFVHHLTVLLAPMAVLAGAILAPVATPGLRGARLAAAGALCVSALVAYGIWLPDAVDHSRHVLMASSSSPNLAPKLREAAWLDAHSAPGDAVVVDDQVIAVLAHRLVPSALSDTSTVRCTAGYLSLSTLIQATTAARVKTVLLTRALRNNPACTAYARWLGQAFDPVPLPPNLAGASAFMARVPAARGP